jgi:WD40 repeat protein
MVQLTQNSTNEIIREGTVDIEAGTRFWINFEGKRVQPLPAMPHAKATFRFPGGHVWAIAFSPDGTRLATGHDKLRLMGKDGGVWTFERECNAHSKMITGAVFSPDGRWIASCGEDAKVIIWDVEREEILRTLGPFDHQMNIAFSSDGSLLATASHTGIVRVWNTSTWKLNWQWNAHQKVILDIDFSPDGTLLATASKDFTAKIWSVQSRECLHTLHGHTYSVLGVAFEPGGQYLATSGMDSAVKLWSIETGACVRSLPTRSFASQSAFSPDGNLLAVGDMRCVKIWDWRTGVLVDDFFAH